MHFTSFPSGRLGIGLLLLRLAVGITFVVEGVYVLGAWPGARLEVMAVGLLDVASGACLILGVYTPAAAVFAALGAVVYALVWLPLPHPGASDRWLPMILVGVIAAAVTLLGPGAYSLDARRFGYREIVIRRNPERR
jgi:uncharacterized membrane protein YphA (DoxX/SURF4 family)